MDQLTSELRRQANALRFVRKVARGFIARVRYRHMRMAVAAQRANVQQLFSMCEVRPTRGKRCRARQAGSRVSADSLSLPL